MPLFTVYLTTATRSICVPLTKELITDSFKMSVPQELAKVLKADINDMSIKHTKKHHSGSNTFAIISRKVPLIQ